MSRPQGIAAAYLVAALGIATEGRAGPTTVTIQLHGSALAEATGALNAKAKDGRSALVETPFRCKAGKACLGSIDLPETSAGWVLAVSAPGHWASPEVVVPGGTVDLWPTGTLQGNVQKPQGEEPISELTVKFSPSAGAKAPERFPNEGSVTCPVVEKRFECVVPAGTLDLRLRVKGHVSVYRWGQVVAAAEVLGVGNLELKRGASLVGRVVSNERDAPKPGACTVRLEPPGRASARAKDEAELPRAGVDKRGFFQLEVIPAGRWVVVAEQEGFAPVRRSVTIVEGMEANLKEPLVLARPARLELSLAPPQDPDGKPWMVELLDTGGEGRVETVATAPASLGGFWSKDGLPSGGRFMVRVRSSAAGVWWADTAGFELTAPLHRRTLELGFEEVTGTVRLGEKPLAALVTFGAPEENLSIALRSDSGGRLSGALPRLGKWRVVVTSEMPSVHRETEVDAQRGLEGKGRIEIVIPDRALTGEIVDEEGKHLERAILTVSAMTSQGSDRSEKTQNDVEGGLFRLTGYEPGRYVLRAEGGERVSEMVPAEIASDGSSEFVRIVAVRRAVIDLRLVNEDGSPISGARVNHIQVTQFPALTSRSGTTRGDGRVSFPAHPGVPQACFAFNYPGLPLRLFAVPTGSKEQEVVIPAASGTIEIEKSASKEGEALVLWQGPCFMPLPLLKSFKRTTESRFTGIAPGQYSLCRHPLNSPGAPPTCQSGFLAPNGILSFQVGSGS